MRELGTRTDGDELITILELNEYEMSVLSELLEKRDLAAEASVVKAWAKGFSEKARRLNISTRALNALLRQVWSTERGNVAIWTFSLAEGGPPLEFDEWARRIVETHDSKGRAIKRTFPMLVGGAKSNAEIMAALVEYVANA
jgi:hypothetical protein